MSDDNEEDSESKEAAEVANINKPNKLDSKYYYTQGSDIIGPCSFQQILDLNLNDDVLIKKR